MIESVLNQSHRDFELLIVDDRSVDETPRIAREYAAADRRVMAVDSTGVVGKNQAWNRAYDASTGDLVMYFGADDIMPVDALAIRAIAFAGINPASIPAAAFSKVRMFSDDKKFDGVVVPRGPRGSRSGGTTTLTRRMAKQVFPISTELPNEDVWTSTIVGLRAAVTVEAPEVVVLYRIHSGNSFNRKQGFSEANVSLHSRNIVYEKLLSSAGYDWSPEERAFLTSKMELERLRYQGEVLALAKHRGVSTSEKLRLMSQASSTLYMLRQRFYSKLSGW